LDEGGGKGEGNAPSSHVRPSCAREEIEVANRKKRKKIESSSLHREHDAGAGGRGAGSNRHDEEKEKEGKRSRIARAGIRENVFPLEKGGKKKRGKEAAAAAADPGASLATEEKAERGLHRLHRASKRRNKGEKGGGESALVFWPRRSVNAWQHQNRGGKKKKKVLAVVSSAGYIETATRPQRKERGQKKERGARRSTPYVIGLRDIAMGRGKKSLAAMPDKERRDA